MNDKRIFSDVPRTYITFSVVTGGIIGLILSQAYLWDIVPTFLITLGIALLCVSATVLVYRALNASRQR